MADLCSPPDLPRAGMRHYWTGLNKSAAAMALAHSLEAHGLTSLIITADVADAERLQHELSLFVDSDRAEKIKVFPDWETLPYDSFSPHQDIISDRLRCLYDLTFREGTCIIVAAQTLLQRLVPTQYLKQKSLSVSLSEKINREAFCDTLIESGYNRVDTVFQHGEFAVRGALIDIYPMGSEQAFRLELFDDEVDSLREFDPETQRTIRSVESIELLPGRECPLDQEGIARFKENWHREFDVDVKACPVYQDVAAGHAPAGVEYFSALFFENSSLLTDYVPQDTPIYTFSCYDSAFESYWREITQRYELSLIHISEPTRPY